MSAATAFDRDFESTGATEEMAPEPVGGPAAWWGRDMRVRPAEWTYEFSAAEVAELDDAMRRSRSLPLVDIGKSDYPLPKLAAVLDDIRQELLHGRGFVLLRGVPVGDYTIEESARVYWGIGMHFGTARSQNGKGHVLGHVRDLGVDPFGNAGARIYASRIRQLFHTDSTDFVGLLCLQKAKKGGESSISSSVTVHDEMWRRDRTLWAELYKPFWRDRRNEIPAGRKPYYPQAAFHYYKGMLSTIYSRDYMESTQRYPEIPRLTDVQIAAMDMFDSLASDKDIRLDMAFQPGDIQLLHNHQILHARADFEDWPEPERKRHLLRLWLCPPDGRPLPPSFLERYLTVEIGDRGGIIVPGVKPNAPLVAE